MESPASQKVSRVNSATHKDHKSAKSARNSDNKHVKGAEKDGRGGWISSKMGKMTGWLHTSEPSVYALMGHQKAAFQKAGVSPKDDADKVHARVRAPIGKIPKEAISPIGGPTPEEVLRQKKEEKKRRKHSTSHSQSRISESIAGRSSSGGSSISTRKGSLSSPSAANPADDWSQDW
ncbi:hypothetical protein QBC44DRAFT_122266 [Cladorrhinum sp. PSN332]|nr:hypothetical protein QBC44DRAFT_122266 [Cladorrhinum sp. PSN332]